MKLLEQVRAAIAAKRSDGKPISGYAEGWDDALCVALDLIDEALKTNAGADGYKGRDEARARLSAPSVARPQAEQLPEGWEIHSFRSGRRCYLTLSGPNQEYAEFDAYIDNGLGRVLCAFIAAQAEQQNDSASASSTEFDSPLPALGRQKAHGATALSPAQQAAVEECEQLAQFYGREWACMGNRIDEARGKLRAAIERIARGD